MTSSAVIIPFTVTVHDPARGFDYRRVTVCFETDSLTITWSLAIETDDNVDDLHTFLESLSYGKQDIYHNFSGSGVRLTPTAGNVVEFYHQENVRPEDYYQASRVTAKDLEMHDNACHASIEMGLKFRVNMETAVAVFTELCQLFPGYDDEEDSDKENMLV